MRNYEVQEGECLTAIAVAHGFVDRRKILDESANSELARQRPNPNLLRPGDRVSIPDVDPGEQSCSTNRTHRFVIELPTKELRVVLRGHDGEPLAGQDYTLELERETRAGSTDGDGKLVEPVSIRERSAVLTIGERAFVLRFSRLGPVGAESDEEIRDLQSRLHNLGYDVGELDGIYGRATRAALAVFQAENGLQVTGEPDGATRAKLEELHGC